MSRECSNNLYLKYAGKPRHYQVRKTLPLLGSCVPTTPFHVLKLNQAKASTRKKVFHSLSLRRFLEILYPFTKRRQDEASVIGTGARTGAPQNEPRKGSFTRGSWKAWRSCAPSEKVCRMRHKKPGAGSSCCLCIPVLQTSKVNCG